MSYANLNQVRRLFLVPFLVSHCFENDKYRLIVSETVMSTNGYVLNAPITSDEEEDDLQHINGQQSVKAEPEVELEEDGASRSPGESGEMQCQMPSFHSPAKRGSFICLWFNANF